MAKENETEPSWKTVRLGPWREQPPVDPLHENHPFPHIYSGSPYQEIRIGRVADPERAYSLLRGEFERTFESRMADVENQYQGYLRQKSEARLALGLPGMSVGEINSLANLLEPQPFHISDDDFRLDILTVPVFADYASDVLTARADCLLEQARRGAAALDEFRAFSARFFDDAHSDKWISWLLRLEIHAPDYEERYSDLKASVMGDRISALGKIIWGMESEETGHRVVSEIATLAQEDPVEGGGPTAPTEHDRRLHKLATNVTVEKQFYEALKVTRSEFCAFKRKDWKKCGFKKRTRIEHAIDQLPAAQKPPHHKSHVPP